MKNTVDFAKVILFELGDCTLDGVSKGKNEIIVLRGSDEFLEECKQDHLYDEAVVYTERVLWGENHNYLKPLHEKPGVGPMSGGNKAVLPNGETLKIHDRFESQEMYDMLSR